MEECFFRSLRKGLSDSDYGDVSDCLDNFLNENCKCLDESVSFGIKEIGPYAKHFVCSHDRVVEHGVNGLESDNYIVSEEVVFDGRGDVASYQVFVDGNNRVPNFVGRDAFILSLELALKGEEEIKEGVLD